MAKKEALATQGQTPEAEIAERRGRLSYDEVSALLKLDASGKKQQEIAEIFGISQSNVSRIISQFKDTRVLAKQRLHGAAELLADRVLHAADVAAVIAAIKEADSIRDRSRVARVNMHIPMILLDRKNETLLRQMLSEIKAYADKGAVTWATQVESYEGYRSW